MTLEKDHLLNDRFRILEILGQGGMGAVYRARDENLDVEVAVKENLFTSEEYSRQFWREANILAAMRHPNLPRVIDHFEIDDQGQYMVMDYIEGEDLRQRMDRVGSLPDEEVIIIGAAICDALEYLHNQNPSILHRDIKPGNIKINPTGQVYLVDFGLAKIVHGSQVTTTGARAMTPGYSSPEQYGTARTDERSDVYSLGATLYAALTNTIPEDGLARAMEQADLTPIRKRNPKVGRRVATTVEKALSVHPEDRYQRGEEFKTALLMTSNATRQIQHAEELTIVPPPPEVIAEVAEGKRLKPQGAKEPEISGVSSQRLRRLRWRKVRRFFLSMFLLLILAGVVWWGAGMPGKENLTGYVPNAWLGIAPPPPTATQPGPTATLSGLVETNVPTLEDEHNPELTHTSLPTITLTPTNTPIPPTPTITPTPTAISVPSIPTATPTPLDYPAPYADEQLAFASQRSGIPQIYLYSFADESIEQLTDLGSGACQPSWSPDGRLLLFISPCFHNQYIYTNTYIFVLDMDTREKTQLAVPEGSFDAAWSPDGAYILFTTAESTSKSSIYRITTADAEIELMSTGDRITLNPAWSPEGDRLVFTSNRTGQHYLYVMENEPGQEPIQFSKEDDKVYYKPTWSANGHITYSRGTLDSFLSLYTMPQGLIGASELIYEENRTRKDSVIDPGLDPDYNSNGHWIAYLSWGDEGNRDIYIIREDGQMVLRITTGGLDDFDPAWRPYPHQ